MLYIFAGFPGKDAPPGTQHLNAGGLQYAAEERMGIVLLEHDNSIQHRKEGVFINTERGEERLRDVEHRMSDLCLRDGITWDWFPENTAFGNGVTIHKTTANREMKTVVHETEDSLDKYLRRAGPTRISDLVMERKHIITEGWDKYERRWMPGTCPQESHVVHLTWLVTMHKLPPFAYDTIRLLIEAPGLSAKEELFEQRHFSQARTWDGNASADAGRNRS